MGFVAYDYDFGLEFASLSNEFVDAIIGCDGIDVE
jgi:hypothetical protein